MSIPTIPSRLEDWNIHDIDSLLPILSIESETFDFKGHDFNKRSDELYCDFCAMANTSGGYIVIGIDEEKAPDGKIIRFIKKGFERGEEDKINQTIANNMYSVDPTPNIEQRSTPVYEKDEKYFYPVIRVNSVERWKPYFTKTRCQCYVRVGNTSKPAGRTVVLNLLSEFKERKKSVIRLRLATNIVKESLMFTSTELESINPSGLSKITPIDLNIFRESISSTEWLLSDKMGGHINNKFGSYQSGIHSNLRKLESLNLYIYAYNNEMCEDRKREIKQYICDRQFWCPNREQSDQMLLFLDGISKIANEFLSKEQGKNE
jgi:Putative DNA-binding domain